MDESGLQAIKRRPTLETTPSNPHVNADLDPSLPIEPGSADPKPANGDQTKQLSPVTTGQSPTASSPSKLPLLQTAIAPEKRPNPALSSPLDPLTPSNLYSPPAVVVKSQWEANAPNEASEDSRAIQEKNEMENELHSKVPESPVTSESPTETKRSLLGMLGLTKS